MLQRGHTRRRGRRESAPDKRAHRVVDRTLERHEAARDVQLVARAEARVVGGIRLVRPWKDRVLKADLVSDGLGLRRRGGQRLRKGELHDGPKARDRVHGVGGVDGGGHRVEGLGTQRAATAASERQSGTHAVHISQLGERRNVQRTPA